VTATLYRCRTPTNWLCPCGRVARELARRELDHDTVRLPRSDRSAVVDLTGQRHVPVLDIEEEAIADSKRIVEHLAWLADR
jgi:Glutathione S-transferase, N-terminal domain